MDMHKRRITLADGRYLIFYTFEGRGVPPAPSAETDAEVKRPEPQPLMPQASDERLV